MKFKDLRNYIFSECRVILDSATVKVETHYPTKFDDFEVEGIRSRDVIINGYTAGSYIEVLLKWNT